MADAPLSASDRRALLFVELGRLGAEPDEQATLTRVTALAQASLPGSLAVSITMRSGGTDFTFASSDGLADELDEQQYLRGSGPCTDALESGRPVISRDLATEPRWAEWTTVARAAGVHGMHCVPLDVAGDRLGALNVYAGETPSGDDPARDVALQLLTAYVTTVLDNLRRVSDARVVAEQLRQAMASRAVIEQAKGILMGQLGVDADVAWQYLVKLSQESHRKLRDIAVAVTQQAASGKPIP